MKESCYGEKRAKGESEETRKKGIMVIFVEAVDHDTIVAIHVLEGVAGSPHKLINVGAESRCKHVVREQGHKKQG